MNHKIQDKWEKRSSVRSRPRIIFDPSSKGYFLPISHQPLAAHPKILEKGNDALNYLLTQSFYKYSNDIAVIETRVVNNAILTVVTNTLPIEFSEEQKLNLYTIMVDESYHAYVAYDCMMQIEKNTHIAPLPLPKTIEIERAMVTVKEKLPGKYHGVFDLIAVCLAENTLTKEIVSMIDKSETHPFFQKMIDDHLSDESRHSGIFFHLLKYIWEKISDEYKENIANILPSFLELYLGVQVQMEFERKILIQLGFSENEATSMLEETYKEFRLTKDSPLLKNILMQLDRAGLIDKFTSPMLKEKNWLLQGSGE